jgi:hypothetical protein
VGDSREAALARRPSRAAIAAVEIRRQVGDKEKDLSQVKDIITYSCY